MVITISNQTLLNIKKEKWEILKVSTLDQLIMPQELQLQEKLEKESSTWIPLTTHKLILEIDPQVVLNGCLHMPNKRKEKLELPKIRIIIDKTMLETFLTISRILEWMKINHRWLFKQIIILKEERFKKTKMLIKLEMLPNLQKATLEEVLIIDRQMKEET